MDFLSRLFGRGKPDRKTVTTTAANPYRIPKPVVGFVCVTPEFEALMEADKAALGPLFFEARSSTEMIVPCHVLFLYCRIDGSGALPGVQMRIRDFVKAAGACIAVVASENAGENYLQALDPKIDWPANIVLVVDRRGGAFTKFFQDLFGAMKGGTSMLMAWVKLAPQVPNQDHPECPSSLMLAEAGHITFDGRV